MEKILIIDDDTQLTELLIEFLGSYKYEVIVIRMRGAECYIMWTQNTNLTSGVVQKRDCMTIC